MPLALLLALARAGWSLAGAAEPGASGPAEASAARIGQLYEAARAAFLQEPTNATTAWRFGRACFDWAELATNNTQRVTVAQDGVIACRAAIRADTNLAAGPYYLGMNLGQLARVKRFSALGLLDDMRDQFETARRLDERFDEAGPDRNLGLLHRDAPGWPLSLGDRTKAEQHLARAVALAPDYPENRLNLLESRLRWGQRQLVATELEAVATLLPRARAVYRGEAWESSWEDWDRRWSEVLRRARKLGIRMTAESPREPPGGGLEREGSRASQRPRREDRATW